MNAITPESFSKRSFVYRKLSGASFTELAGGALAADLMNGRSQAEKSGLLDLSVLPRTGYRGFNAPAHIQAAGLPVPAQPNQASVSANGELVLRLSQKEFWVLAAAKEKKVLSAVKLESGMSASPVAANGVLYIATMETLYVKRPSRSALSPRPLRRVSTSS